MLVCTVYMMRQLPYCTHKHHYIESVMQETQGLSKGEYNHAMMKVHQKRGEQTKEVPQWQQRLREDLSHSLDQRVKDRLAGCSTVPEKHHRTKDNTGAHFLI